MAGPLTLRSGGESRLAGAPDQLLPSFADDVEALAQALLAEDVDGLYMEDIDLARAVARQQLQEMSDRSRAGQAAAAQAGADRNRARAARQGVVPESLPMDEYGGVSARTVRTANMSPEDQEAEQAQYDGLAGDEIRAMRAGRFHGAEAQARQHEQDYGLPTTRSKTGKTDLDYLREQQQQQGFIRTGRGEMIPIGPAPTPESIASRRGFNEWANETPGTERQARYDPKAYAEWQEARAQEIQDNARKEMQTYGTGSDDPEVRADTGLAPLTPEQMEARARRARGEQRAKDQAIAAKERRRERLESDPEYAAEVQAREDDKKARRQRVADNAQMRARGVPQAIGMLPEADRADAIRGLLPNRNAAGDVANRDFQLKLKDMEAQQADRQRDFEARMKAAEMAQAQAIAAAAEDRARWEAEQKAAKEAREQEAADRAEARGIEERRVGVSEEEVKSQDALAREIPGIKAEAEAGVAERLAAAAEQRALQERARGMEERRRLADVSSYGEGVSHIMEGRFDTPAAHQSLTRIARAADQSSGGFYQADAVRMDAELFRLGVKDPQVRHALVYRYGLGTAPGSTWRSADVQGRGNILSGLGMGFFGGPTFPDR